MLHKENVHEVENSVSAKFEHGTDSVEFKCMQFTTPVFESSQDSQKSQNIMFDEMSTLHHALTHLHLENKARVSSKIKFKLDTGASGNLLPVSTYHELFPDQTMKDLGMTIDLSTELLTATKSSIKQLYTVCLHVYHSQCNSPYICLFFMLSNKCKLILGLPDLMQLNLVSFNCRVSKSWDGYDTSFAFNSCEERSHTILNKDILVNRPRFKSIYSGVGRFPVEPVDIQLTNDAVLFRNQHIDHQSH